jgi:hypothetical protein
MLQRYDIKVDGDTNRLSINEYAVLGRRYRRYGMQEPATPATVKYNLVYEVSYEGDNIRTAIKQGRTALISELRTDGFFPVHACAELLAEKVTDLFDAGEDQFVELFYDDRTAILPEDTAEEDK